jgi:signal transduction histidine kinase
MTEDRIHSRLVAVPESRRRWGSGAALLAGFGALLVLMAIICIDALRSLSAFETRDTQIRNDLVYRQRTLEQVRDGLYESGTIMRDYLLVGETELRARQKLESELQSIRDGNAAALEACIEWLSGDQREPFRRLAAELDNYRSAMGRPIAADAQGKSDLHDPVLRTDVLSQHAELLKIMKEVGAVNDTELKEAEGRIAEASERFRRRLLTVVGMVLTLGLTLAGATTAYVRRLEKNIEEKYRESLRAQIELKGLSKQLVEAEERERRSVSRELHDEVGQSLGALLLEVEALAEMSSGKDGYRQGFQNVKTLAAHCVDQVRNMALLLRPSMLDDLGLVPALQWQAREMSRRTGMLIDVIEENVSSDMPEEFRTCVYRVVQEALNNCSKHAYARNVRIVLRQEAGRLRVNVEDDGKGFDAMRVRGLGLIGMTERVGQLGGVLKVDSDPARGTNLRVELPLPSAAAVLEKLSS